MSDSGAGAPGKPRVLVVDDEESFARAIEWVLRADYDVIVCTGDGASVEALQRIGKGERFDVVLVDAHMPYFDGFALLEWATDDWPDLAERLVLVTGGLSDGEAEIVERRKLLCLEKPVSTHALLAALRARSLSR